LPRRDLRYVAASPSKPDHNCQTRTSKLPALLNAALREGLANTSSPTVIDFVVTRDPARMLPAADNRTLQVRSGDRPV
jgi:hypothetical protein